MPNEKLEKSIFVLSRSSNIVYEEAR